MNSLVRYEVAGFPFVSSVRKFRKNVNTKHFEKIDTHAAGLKTKIKVLAANSKFQGYCVEPINQFNMKKSPK